MLFNPREIFDMLFMSIIVGFIFYKVLERSHGFMNYDPLKHSGFNLDLFKKAVIIAAPAIIFHELGHKFVALGFGAVAEFHAAYTWLFLGLVLAALNTGIIFFVPAFVSIVGTLSAAGFALIAFAGPGVNALFWLFSYIAIKKNLFHKKHYHMLQMTMQVNKFLFIFNMLPIPGFDGFKVYMGLFQTLF